MRRLLTFLLGASLALQPAPLPAQADDPDLAAGFRQVREGDFEGAVTTLEAAVRRLGSLPARLRDLVRAYVELGVAYVALDQKEEARARFREALLRDRSLKLSAAAYSPKVVTVFEEARLESRTAGGGGKGGSRVPLIALGVGAAAGGVVLLTRGGSGTPVFSGARFGTPVVLCPAGSLNVELPVSILVECQAGGSDLTISSASTTLIITTSVITGEVGFGSSRPTAVMPSLVASGARATVTLNTTLLCNNGGDQSRFNEWSGHATLTTTAGVFTVDTADRMRVNIP
jgi:hypothetical protein